MYNQELQAYITASRASGLTDEQIKASLLNHGWVENDVNDALANENVPLPTGQPELTSIGTRFLNNILDSIFSSVLIWLFVFVITASGLLKIEDMANPQSSVGYLWLYSIILSVGYYLLFESIWQKTPGKMITGTKVVMRDGSKANFMHIFGRTLARFIPFDPVSFLFRPNGWHDRLSNTIVVPKHYTSLEVNRIDFSQKPKRNIWLIIVAVGLVFVAIIGILASVVLVSLNGARAKARDSQRVANVRQIESTLELYYIDNGTYPSSLSELSDYGLVERTAPVPADGECTEEQNQYQYVGLGDNYNIKFCLGSDIGTYKAGVQQLTPR